MPNIDRASLDRARRARDRLELSLLDHPNVTMIDIGLMEAIDESSSAGEEVVIRVHVRDEGIPATTHPKSVDGFRVVVMRGEYRPEGR